ncbi:MAG TPA: 8-oxo-dGTP diphosphatase [Candidatus Paceibacterota bacterium]
MDKKILTLAIVHQSPKVLLGLKKRGMGEGRWNGFGGHVEEGETVEEAATRELEEEAGILASSLEKLGELTFEFKEDPTLLLVHLFKVREFAGEPIETDEMRPIWFAETEVPFDSMWPDDFLWFPYFLAGRKFKGYFMLGDQDTLLEHEIKEVEKFEENENLE